MNNKSKYLFSLVELIVVLSIIAVMASLLQPSLSSLLKSSRILSCKKNLSQIGISMNLYTGDHHHYPLSIFKTNPKFTFGSWDDLLGQGYDGRNLTESEVGSPQADSPNNMYVCDQQNNADPETNGYVRSYAMNCNQNSFNMGGFATYWGHGDDPKSVTVDEVPAPSTSILLLELKGRLGSGYNNAGSFGSGSQSGSFDTMPERYHEAQFNYLFADNHVELLLSDETRDPSKGTWVYGKYWTRDPSD